jgi:very-short-patch-repair endonuclease
MRRPLVPAELRDRPFTTAEAMRHGLSKDALLSPPWRQVFRGVWVHIALDDTRELRLAAIRLLLPPWAVVVGVTAAWVHGVDVRREDDLDIHVGFPKGRRGRHRPGVVTCQETLDAGDVTNIDGVPVTTAVRTAFDCARLLHGVERVVVVDAMAHARLVAIDDIRAYVAGKRRLRNLRRAETLLDICDEAAESPMESRLRVLLIGHGMCPQSQIEVRDAHGRFVGRLDLGFPDVKVGVEYDGADHWDRRKHDNRRRARIREQGWVVLVYSSEDYYDSPRALVDEVFRTVTRRRFVPGGSQPLHAPC